jgi:hypothetical protein
MILRYTQKIVLRSIRCSAMSISQFADLSSAQILGAYKGLTRLNID